MTTKKSYTAAEKAKIALKAIKGKSTINDITQRFGVHSQQISVSTDFTRFYSPR